MAYFYLKLVPLFILIFLVLSLTARVLGTTQPPNPALRGFTEGCEDKPQPCWYGIVPGVTTAEEAIELLDEQGYVLDADPATTIFSRYEPPKGSMIQFVQFNHYSEQTKIVHLMVLAFEHGVQLG